MLLIALATALGVTVPPLEPETNSSSDSAQLAEVMHVADGDTITVRIDNKEERVRYIGIDTPEIKHNEKPAECYGDVAKMRNESLVLGQTVTLQRDREDRDTYGRLLRYVYVDDIFINQLLLEEGYATALPIKPNTQHASDFAQIQRTAKADKLGLWGTCQ